ncbi:uncharacterized protein LY89DRAFT_328752 [Mollisia scopiformis]|uniref:Uncharacterized protein n=1 Tax=Mollisia scopiformis TaxID=149040 RepID=A0A132B917_MOLSC|nr:uncharacterized protein LY89DRAFT_328752 [Mollisia scopiformis]KUJ08896.1 hypothetical protein LY89DRAFT_328752 [Mollisia scopiformis]
MNSVLSLDRGYVTGLSQQRQFELLHLFRRSIESLERSAPSLIFLETITLYGAYPFFYHLIGDQDLQYSTMATETKTRLLRTACRWDSWEIFRNIKGHEPPGKLQFISHLLEAGAEPWLGTAFSSTSRHLFANYRLYQDNEAFCKIVQELLQIFLNSSANLQTTILFSCWRETEPAGQDKLHIFENI